MFPWIINKTHVSQILLFLLKKKTHVSDLMKEKIKSLIANYKTLIIIYLIFAIAASTISLGIGSRFSSVDGMEYKRYNNYVIFESSYSHLVEGRNLYDYHPDHHYDLYKYSPSFSVFFGVFHALPDWLGLSLWNILNALILLMAVYYLPLFNSHQKGLILLISVVELMTSLQNNQSNGLMVGLMLFSFGFMERDKPFWGTLFMVLSVYVKLFSLVGFVLFLFYPKKWKTALYSLIWAAVILAIPLLYIPWEQYEYLLCSYLNMLGQDHSASYGFSVMGWLNSWFCVDMNKFIPLILGTLLLLIPYLKLSAYKSIVFRYLSLSSVLIWVIIFNHKAESPTFIIAAVGVAIWFVMSPKNGLNITLFILFFVFSSLAPTDVFPVYVRHHVFEPYVVKAVPCILIWVKISWELFSFKKKDEKGSHLAGSSS